MTVRDTSNENELAETLLMKDPTSSKANFLSGYLKTYTDKTLAIATSEHMEVTCRITLTIFLSYMITFSDIRWITPIDSAPDIAVLLPFIAMLFPTLVFAFGLLTLPLVSIWIFTFVSSTMLLAVAAAGGSGWYIVAFTLWTFWISWMRWDKEVGANVPLILVLVVFNTAKVFPTFETVQEGFVLPNPELPPPASQNAMLGYLEGTISAAIAMGAGSHDLVVDDGVFAGRNVVVTVNEDGQASSTFVEGGMWLVTGMWTQSGINNPLAFYQNQLVFVSWLVLILALIPLLPPFRTMRSALWRGMIPGAMMDAAALLRLHVDSVDKEGSLDADGSSLAQTKGKIGVLIGQCTQHMNVLYEGNIAKFTFFEPRVLDCKPAEITGGYLMQLSVLVTRIMSAAAGISLFTNNSFCYHNMDHYLLTANNLETCAKALAIGDRAILDSVDLSNDSNEHDSFTMHQRTMDIVQVARKFLGAMTGSGDRPSYFSKGTIRATFTNLRPWIWVHFAHYFYLAGYLLVPFKKGSWKSLSGNASFAKTKLVWCIKYAFGMGLLVLLSTYWPAYSGGFAVGDDPFKKAYAAHNGVWMLFSYCVSTTHTTEGTVKKAVLRISGTLLGGFTAYLALLTCQDASFKSGYNTYGLIAWMTITAFIATYTTTAKGFLARLSLNLDYSMGSIFFLVTQTIIIIGTTAFGSEHRDMTVANRVIANIVGILMATVLAIIPPGCYGSDPTHTIKINTFHWNSVRAVIERLTSLGGKTCEEAKDMAKELEVKATDITKTAAQMLELTNDFYEDAGMLPKFPAFPVDPNLKMQIGLVTRDNQVASFIPRLVSQILVNDISRPLLLEKDGVVQKKLNELLTNIKRGGLSGADVKPFAEFHLPSYELVDARDDIDLLVRTIQWLIIEMRSRDTGLQRVEWGAFRGMMGPIKL